MVNCTDQPERRTVRRRLVQSTLFRHKSPEIEPKVERKAKEAGEDNSGGEDEEFCGSQGKKRGRKPKGKGTPQKKAKGKSPRRATPKKNVIKNLVGIEDSSPLQIPNLRLEEKLTAEENSRMFAGRQIHPFFEPRKAEKRIQGPADVGRSSCLIDRSEISINVGPIHVFERNQDDVVLDWKDWTYFQKTSVNACCNLKGPPAFENCVGVLCLDNFPVVSHSSDTSFIQRKLSEKCVIQDNDFLGTLLAIPLVLIDEELESYQQVKSSGGDCQLDETNVLSQQADDVENSEHELQTRLFQESIQPDNSLWTDKYQPKKATEVCGNTESVKFMSDWLHHWRQRSFQVIKASNNTDKGNMQDDDYDYHESDLDSEDIDGEDSLKNVLLVTGPIGSGKSAAINACAKEQGFKLLESNASDCRNGAVVKQKFAGALESYCLTRSLEKPIDSLSKHVIICAQPLSNGQAVQGFGDEVKELIPISDDEDSFGAHRASGIRACIDSETGCTQAKAKPLILIEDVDISFPEDRGFLAAIQQIAKKARVPVILTSNSNDVVLPDNLGRLELCFTIPSSEELLQHLHMICTAEKATIQPHLLEQLIKSCHGDIRKTILHLQFWCQSKKFQKDRKLQKNYDLLLFDIEAAHSVLPTIIPWDFPSQLSELIENEIEKTLSMMAENSTLMEVKEERENHDMPNGLEVYNNEMHCIEAKKEVMLSRNPSIQDCNEFMNPSYTADELYNSSATPVSFSRRTRRKKLDVVMSSDSEDDHFDKPPSLVSDKNVNRELFIEDSVLLSHHPNMQNCINPLMNELLCSEAVKHEDRSFQCSETANTFQIETCKSVDVSCAPESSFVPETEIVDGMDLSYRTLTDVNVDETTEVSASCVFTEVMLPVEENNLSKAAHTFVKTPDMLGSTCNVSAEASHEEVVENSPNDYEALPRGHAVMDECSRIVFNNRSIFMAKFNNQVASDLVQESWKKLRHCRADLKQYIGLEPKDALKVLKLTSRMSDLISQADQMFSKCQMQDSLELFPSDNFNALSQFDEQLQMFDTISQHVFCFYAKDIEAVGSKIGFEQRVNLSQEILASSTSTMAVGRLLQQDGRADRTSVDGKGLDMSLVDGKGLGINPSKYELAVKRDVKSCLFNIIGSIVPSRSYLALRGAAFLEYISSLRCISKSEASRISVGEHLRKRRRERRALHYLSTGALMLSPEDISLLDQSNFNEKLPSNS